MAGRPIFDMARDHPKILWVILNFAAFFIFFVPIAYTIDPARAISMATPLDDALPFVRWSFWGYSFAYLSTFAVLFVIRSGRLFHYAGASFFVVLMISILFYVLIPVTTRDFRPIATTFEDGTFMGWMLRMNWFIDRPYNCFPSLHVGAAFIAAFSCRRAHRRVGQLTLVWAVLISISALLMKQHFIADLLFGLVLALAAKQWILKRYIPSEDPDKRPPHFPPRIMALFIPAYFLMIGAAYFLYQIGWQPWAGKPVY